jgi:cytoskeletal protein RodZ
MDIGNDLRSARLARRLSIDDIARETKVPPTLLRALEQNQFEALPGGLFTRGYLRAYARQVGLDPEQIVERYRHEFETPPVSLEPEAPQAKADDRFLNAAEESRSSGTAQAIALVVIGVAALIYFGSMREPVAQSSKLNPPTTDAIDAAVPVPTTGSAAAPPADPLHVEILASGPCWVVATADGEQVLARLLSAGERRQISVRDEVALRVGDPATFALSINGVAARPLGSAGQPINVRITRDNYKTFLQRG